MGIGDIRGLVGSVGGIRGALGASGDLEGFWVHWGTGKVCRGSGASRGIGGMWG